MRAYKRMAKFSILIAIISLLIAILLNFCFVIDKWHNISNRRQLDCLSALKIMLCVSTLRTQLPYVSFLLHSQEDNN